MGHCIMRQVNDEISSIQLLFDNASQNDCLHLRNGVGWNWIGSALD